MLKNETTTSKASSTITKRRAGGTERTTQTQTLQLLQKHHHSSLDRTYGTAQNNTQTYTVLICDTEAARVPENTPLLPIPVRNGSCCLFHVVSNVSLQLPCCFWTVVPAPPHLPTNEVWWYFYNFLVFFEALCMSRPIYQCDKDRLTLVRAY